MDHASRGRHTQCGLRKCGGSLRREPGEPGARRRGRPNRDEPPVRGGMGAARHRGQRRGRDEHGVLLQPVDRIPRGPAEPDDDSAHGASRGQRRVRRHVRARRISTAGLPVRGRSPAVPHGLGRERQPAYRVGEVRRASLRDALPRQSGCHSRDAPGDGPLRRDPEGERRDRAHSLGAALDGGGAALGRTPGDGPSLPQQGPDGSRHRPQRRALFLDFHGNQNDEYDLGDFRAWILGNPGHPATQQLRAADPTVVPLFLRREEGR